LEKVDQYYNYDYDFSDESSSEEEYKE
jgi:hypothetical protein